LKRKGFGKKGGKLFIAAKKKMKRDKQKRRKRVIENARAQMTQSGAVQ